MLSTITNYYVQLSSATKENPILASAVSLMEALSTLPKKSACIIEDFDSVDAINKRTQLINPFLFSEKSQSHISILNLRSSVSRNPTIQGETS